MKRSNTAWFHFFLDEHTPNKDNTFKVNSITFSLGDSAGKMWETKKAEVSFPAHNFDLTSKLNSFLF